MNGPRLRARLVLADAVFDDPFRHGRWDGVLCGESDRATGDLEPVELLAHGVEGVEAHDRKREASRLRCAVDERPMGAWAGMISSAAGAADPHSQFHERCPFGLVRPQEVLGATLAFVADAACQ